MPSRDFFSSWLHHNAIFLDQPEDHLEMALYAYLDESGKFHDGHGFISLCALLSDGQGWEPFNKTWNHLLRKHQFSHIHTTEFFSECRRRGWDRPKIDAVLTEFIDAIRDNVLAAFAVGIDGPYFRKRYESVGKPKTDPALFAVQRILRGIADCFKKWEKGRGIPARISLTFDEDETYSLQCYRIISRLRKIRPEVKSLVSAITFADDEVYPPLQAVDILANLTSRYWRERLDNNGEADFPLLLARLISAPEAGYTIMWEPELWDADGIDRNWDSLRQASF